LCAWEKGVGAHRARKAVMVFGNSRRKMVSFRQQCMIFPENHALLPKAYVETEEAEPGINSSFDEPMILLDDIIEVLSWTLSIPGL
jgi:hypothetical protein